MISTLEEVPPNWIKVKFEDIARNITKRIDNPAESGLEYYIGLEHLDTDQIRIKRFGSTDDVKATKFLCKKGDIIFGKRNAYLRKVAVTDRDAVVSAHSMIIRPKGDLIIPEFLPCFMQSSVFWKTAHAISEGSMSPTIKWKTLAKQEFWIPSIIEQKKMSQILWMVEENIQNTEQLIDVTEKMKKDVLNELLRKGIGHNSFKETDIGKIPQNWDIITTDDMVINQKGAIKIGPFGSQLEKSILVNEGYKVYGQENVFKSDFKLGNRFVGEEKFDQLKTCAIQPGDFLITMMGTIGKCAIVPDDIETGIMDSHLLRLRIDESKYSREFLIHLFKSDLIQIQLINLSVGGIMAGLSSKVIKQLIFPKPSLLEQKQFSNILNSFDYNLNAHFEYLESLKDLKCKLTNDLISGRFRIQREALRNVQ